MPLLSRFRLNITEGLQNDEFFRWTLTLDFAIKQMKLEKGTRCVQCIGSWTMSGLHPLHRQSTSNWSGKLLTTKPDDSSINSLLLWSVYMRRSNLNVFFPISIVCRRRRDDDDMYMQRRNDFLSNDGLSHSLREGVFCQKQLRRLQ